VDKTHILKGENWRAVGMLVLGLDQVDEDLAAWTA
jgi:hypothetical protein